MLTVEDEIPHARLADELLASTTYGGTTARVKALMERGRGCRATFFNDRRKLGSTNGTGEKAGP